MRDEEGNVPPAIPFEFSETYPKRSSLLYVCPSSVKLYIRRSLSPQKSMFAPGGRSQGPSENGRPDTCGRGAPEIYLARTSLRWERKRPSALGVRVSSINFSGAAKGVRPFSDRPSPFRPFWGHQNGHPHANEAHAIR